MRGAVPFTAWIVALLLATGSVAYCELMYARFSTSVRAERSLGSEVVARLKQGDAVTVLDREGRHYRVLVGGREGWIYYNKLAAQAPEDVAALLASTPWAGPVQLSELEAGGALRGLSTMARKYAARAQLPDWTLDALREIQSMSIPLKELERFQQQGRLGEYGGAP